MRKLLPSLARLLLPSTLVVMHAAGALEPFPLLHSLIQPAAEAQPNAAQGNRVALDGNLAVVGIPNAHAGGQNSGG